jgi:hypothetical protein
MFYVVPNYEFAEVNELGQIRSSFTKSIYKPFKDKDGYFRCKVWDGSKLRGIYVHRAVALVFVPNHLNKPFVNHIDSNRANNSISNLEWVTAQENSTHGVEAGNFPKAENAFVSAYTNDEIVTVCQMLVDDINCREIARRTSVNISVIYSIKSGRTWQEVSKDFNFSKTKPRVTDDLVLEILKLIESDLSIVDIVNYINHPSVNRHTVSNIKAGKTFKHLRVTFNDQSSDVASSEAKR